jgi:hypothetical protein
MRYRSIVLERGPSAGFELLEAAGESCMACCLGVGTDCTGTAVGATFWTGAATGAVRCEGAAAGARWLTGGAAFETVGGAAETPRDALPALPCWPRFP